MIKMMKRIKTRKIVRVAYHGQLITMDLVPIGTLGNKYKYTIFFLYFHGTFQIKKMG